MNYFKYYNHYLIIKIKYLKKKNDQLKVGT